MKKIAKLSLVAAVAVSGLTTVNAASLEEAIKGVDVSGQFRFRAEERNTEYTTEHTKTDVEVEVGVKVPVTDNVTAVFKIDNAIDEDDGSTSKNALNIEDYYFSYVNGAVTVNAGQQNIPGRLTDGAQGDGLVALYNAGAFTVGAAAFMDHNLVGAATNGQEMATSVIAMGNVGPVSLLGQYINVDDVADSYNLKADASIEMVKLGVEYSETDVDGSSADYETFKAYVSGKAGIVSATASYAATGDNGSGSLHSVAESYADSAETPAEFLLWQLGSAKKSDLSVFAIDASAAVTDKISLRAAYADGDHMVGATKTDVTEILGQVSYKVAKNLNTYVRYSELESEGSEDVQRARVEVRYSF
jgi:hypothetical protein